MTGLITASAMEEAIVAALQAAEQCKNDEMEEDEDLIVEDLAGEVIAATEVESTADGNPELATEQQAEMELDGNDGDLSAEVAVPEDSLPEDSGVPAADISAPAEDGGEELAGTPGPDQVSTEEKPNGLSLIELVDQLPLGPRTRFVETYHPPRPCQIPTPHQAPQTQRILGKDLVLQGHSHPDELIPRTHKPSVGELLGNTGKS